MNDIIDILAILDRSGSMSTGRDDNEGGLRSFVRDQKTLAGDVRFTLCQFDGQDACEVVFDRVPIRDVDESKIVLIPRGSTPLFAAIGNALAHLQGKQAKEPSSQTIVMVITDGGDTGGNGEWTKDKVAARAKEMEKAGASFLYLAADLDAFEESQNAGLGAVTPQGMTTGYSNVTPHSATAMFHTVSNKVAASRMMRSAGMSPSSASAALNFTKQDREDIHTGTVPAFDAGAKTIADITVTTTVSDSKE